MNHTLLNLGYTIYGYFSFEFEEEVNAERFFMLNTEAGALGFKFYKESHSSKLGFFEFVVGQTIEPNIKIGTQYSLQETGMNECIYFIKKDIKNPIVFQKVAKERVLLKFLVDFFPSQFDHAIRQLKREFQIANDHTEEEKDFIHLAVIELLELGVLLHKN